MNMEKKSRTTSITTSANMKGLVVEDAIPCRTTVAHRADFRGSKDSTPRTTTSPDPKRRGQGTGQDRIPGKGITIKVEGGTKTTAESGIGTTAESVTEATVESSIGTAGENCIGAAAEENIGMQTE